MNRITVNTDAIVDKFFKDAKAEQNGSSSYNRLVILGAEYLYAMCREVNRACDPMLSAFVNNKTAYLRTLRVERMNKKETWEISISILNPREEETRQLMKAMERALVAIDQHVEMNVIRPKNEGYDDIF